MLKTNLQGAIYATREMTKGAFRARNSANYSKSIINVSSLLAYKGTVGTATYASTKAGLIGLTRSVAVESSRPVKGTRIRANAVVPGYIETKILDGMFILLPNFLTIPIIAALQFVGSAYVISSIGLFSSFYFLFFLLPKNTWQRHLKRRGNSTYLFIHN